MPANRVIETVYVGPFTDIWSVNSATLYKPGELGARVCTADGRQGQVVQEDTGALTSATNGQVLYWKDKANYIVTNNNSFSVGGAAGSVNEVAGVATTTITAGYYTVIQQQGRHSAVLASNATFTAGSQVVASGTATLIAQTTIGQAPINIPLGVVAVTTTGTAIPTDLAIEGIP